MISPNYMGREREEGGTCLEEGRPRIRVVTSLLNEARRGGQTDDWFPVARKERLSLSPTPYSEKKSSNIYVRSARREGDEDTNTREEREEEPRR